MNHPILYEVLLKETAAPHLQKMVFMDAECPENFVFLRNQISAFQTPSFEQMAVLMATSPSLCGLLVTDTVKGQFLNAISQARDKWCLVDHPSRSQQLLYANINCSPLES